MTRLQRLDIRSFRGITDLSLEFDGGSIVLGGANGTGKSACVDAIEFLYTGEVGSLTGTQGLSLRQHGPHILAAAAEARVGATFADPTASVSRALSGAMTTPPELEAHLAAGARLRFVLRRSQVQQFIHAKPADRYRTMAELIGLEGLDRVEVALKRARDTVDASLQEARAQLATIDSQVAALPDDPPDDAQLVRWANDELENLAVPYRLDGIEDVPAVRTAVLQALGTRDPDRRLEARSRLALELRRGIASERLRTGIDDYLKLASATTVRGGVRKLELLQILRSSRDYIADSHATLCPICERGLDERTVLARLVDRVAELEEVSLYDQRLRQATESLAVTIGDTVARVRAIEPMRTIAEVPGHNSSLLDATAMLTESLRSGALSEIREMAARLNVAVGNWEQWAAGTADTLESEVASAEENHEEHHDASVVLALLERLMTQRGAAERGRAELQRLLSARRQLASEPLRLERVLHIASDTYTTFLRVKNEEVQRIFDELRADLAAMYEFLHPGEEYGNVAIAMDLRKRGSSELRMGFHGRQDEDPRAFASEGHLDSLGLCIFLAFVKRFNGDWPLLVLDDVVASVDAAHKARIARLLFRDFGDRQLLVTTQDSRWFLELRRAQREENIDNCRNLVIESWSVESGPKVRTDTSVLAS